MKLIDILEINSAKRGHGGFSINTVKNVWTIQSCLKKRLQAEAPITASVKMTKRLRAFFEGTEVIGMTIVYKGRTLRYDMSIFEGKRYITEGLMYFHDMRGNLIAQIPIGSIDNKGNCTASYVIA